MKLRTRRAPCRGYLKALALLQEAAALLCKSVHPQPEEDFMSYSSIVEMANNGSLRGRITACVAQEGISNPEAWTTSNIWAIVSQPGWADDWDFAKGSPTPNVNPDTGARTDVIDDAQILSAVQAVQAQP